MPKKSIADFIESLVDNESSFESCVKQYNDAIHELSKNPDMISEEQRSALVSRLEQESSSLLESVSTAETETGRVERALRLAIILWKRLSPEANIEHVLSSQISEPTQVLRKTRKLKKHLATLVHHGEEDVSDLFWVYISGTDLEKETIASTLADLPLEFPFVRLFRAMLSLVEMGSAPELFGLLVHKVFLEAHDGMFSQNEIIAKTQGFTQGAAVSIRRRVSQAVHAEGLLMALQSYPSDKRATPWPILEALSGLNISYRAGADSSIVVGAEKLLQKLSAQEARLGTLSTGNSVWQAAEMFDAVYGLFALPLEPCLATVASRFVLGNPERLLAQKSLQEDAQRNPALLTALASVWMSPSTEQSSFLLSQMNVLAKQGFGGVLQGKAWLEANGTEEQLQDFYAQALGYAAPFCTHVSTLLLPLVPSLVQNKARRHVLLSVFHKKSSLVNALSFVDWESCSAQDRVIFAELLATHFSEPTKRALEQKFSAYWAHNQLSSDEVVWLAKSQNPEFRAALAQAVQEIVRPVPQHKRACFAQYLYKYALEISPQKEFEAVSFHDNVKGNQFLDNAQEHTNFAYFALLRFSMVFSNKDFTTKASEMLKNTSQNEVVLRNPLLFRDTLEAYYRNDWARLSPSNIYQYNQIVPTKTKDLQWEWVFLGVEDSQLVSKIEKEVNKAIDLLTKETFPEEGHAKNAYSQWQEEECQSRFQKSFYEWQQAHREEEYEKRYLPIIDRALEESPLTAPNLIIKYWQHIHRVWNTPDRWASIEPALAEQIIAKKPKYDKNIAYLPFTEIIALADRDKKEGKKQIDSALLWSWLDKRIACLDYDALGACLRVLLKHEDKYSHIQTTKETIEEYMRRLFIHHISLARIKKHLNSVAEIFTTNHLDFLYRWLSFLLRGNTSTSFIGKMLRTRPLEEVVNHRTCRRTMVMVESMYSAIIGFLEQDERPRSDGLFAQIMEVALDVQNKLLADALVNLGYSKRIRNWIANYPTRCKKFFRKHKNWHLRPDWRNPHFPVYLALWQNQPLKREEVIAFLRLGEKPATYAEGLMNCVVSQHPDYFAYMLSMLTNPTPTPTEIIQRMTIRNAIVGLGRIQSSLSKEDRMLIIEKMGMHYRLEVLPLVQLLREEEWTLDMTIDILKSIQSNGFNSNWLFLYTRKNDFTHWFSAFSHIWKNGYFGWSLGQIMAKRFEGFSFNHFKTKSKEDAAIVWEFFSHVDSNNATMKGYLKNVFHSTSIDSIEKIKICISFGLYSEVRVAWALLFQEAAEKSIAEAFGLFDLLNNEQLRRLIMKHHMHLIVDVYRKDNKLFLQQLSANWSSRRWHWNNFVLALFQKFEELNVGLETVVDDHLQEFLSLYNDTEEYNAFKFIQKIQGFSSLEKIEQCLQLLTQEGLPQNNELILRWYRNNRAVLLQSSFLRMALHDQWGLRNPLEAEILDLPIALLRNQAVVWEYLSDASDAPALPDETNTNEYYRKNLASYWKNYTESFFVRLLNKVISAESVEYLVELTFWKGSARFLHNQRRIEFLKEHKHVLVKLAKRDRNAFGKRYMEALYPWQEKTFLPMVLSQVLNDNHTEKLLSTLRTYHSQYSSFVHQTKAYEEEVLRNNEKGEETSTPVPVEPTCWLIGQLNSFHKVPNYLLKLVREMIKEPDQYRYTFGALFFTATFDVIAKEHPRSAGAMLRKFENSIEVSPDLPVFGCQILQHLSFSEIRSSIAVISALYFYRGENPWRPVLDERMKEEPEIKKEILKYALQTLSDRHQPSFSTLEIDFANLQQLSYTRSQDLSFVELPAENKRNTIISTWTDEDDNEVSSYASGGASLSIRNYLQTDDWAYFWAWSPARASCNSGLHVFDEGKLIVHDAEFEAQTESYTASSTSFRIQTHLIDHNKVRFVYGPLQTKNVFENLGSATCRVEYAQRIAKDKYKGASYWDHWKLPVFPVWWTHVTHFSTFQPMSHPHDQSIQLSSPRSDNKTMTLKGGYLYPNMDLSPEFALLDTLFDADILDSLGTTVLMSLLFCPSTQIQTAAQNKLRHRDFKRDDLRHVFVVPHHDWLWNHILAMPEKTLRGLWTTVLSGLSWEEEKRKQQVVQLFQLLYRPKEDAESLVNELEAAGLTPRGFANAQGFLAHSKMLFDAIENMTPALKTRALTCLLSSPLYKEAQAILNELKKDTLMQLHILCNKFVPQAGVPQEFSVDTLSKSFDAELQANIEKNVSNMSLQTILDINQWKELALHSKVGVFTLELSEKLARQSLSSVVGEAVLGACFSAPVLKKYHDIHKADPVGQLASYIVGSLSEQNEALCLQHIIRLHDHLLDSEKWRLMVTWLTMWVHPTSSKFRSLATRMLTSLVKNHSEVRAFVFERISSLASKQERYSGMVEDVIAFLQLTMKDYHHALDMHFVWRMFNGPHRKAQSFALHWMQHPRRLNSKNISLELLQKMGMHSHEEIRAWAMRLVSEQSISTESYIVFLPWLERGSPDVQSFVQNLYRSSELPFSLLLRLVDATQPSVHDLGVELLEKTCGIDLAADVVVQLSEHPDTEAEDYVASKLASIQDAKRLALLVPYFKRVLARVNSGRSTRDTILAYIREKALANAEHAEALLGVMEWMCDIQVVHDRMYALETLTLAQSLHSSLSSSIRL